MPRNLPQAFPLRSICNRRTLLHVGCCASGMACALFGFWALPQDLLPEHPDLAAQLAGSPLATALLGIELWLTAAFGSRLPIRSKEVAANGLWHGKMRSEALPYNDASRFAVSSLVRGAGTSRPIAQYWVRCNN